MRIWVYKEWAARVSGCPALKALKTQVCFDLDHSWRSVSIQERPQKAGGNADRSRDQPELRRTSDIAKRLIEVGVVEKIEELQTYSKLSIFAQWHFEVLHDA